MRFPTVPDLLRASNPLSLLERRKDEESKEAYEWKMGEWFVSLFMDGDTRMKTLESENPWLQELKAGDGHFERSLASLRDSANHTTNILLEYIEAKACFTVYQAVMQEIIEEKKLGHLGGPIQFRRIVGDYGTDVVGREVYEVFRSWVKENTYGNWDEVCNAVRKYCLLAGCPNATPNPFKNIDVLRELTVRAAPADRETLLHTQIERLLSQAQTADAKSEQKEAVLATRIKQLEDDARTIREKAEQRERALQTQVGKLQEHITVSEKSSRDREAGLQAQVRDLQEEVKTSSRDTARMQNEIKEVEDKLGRQNRIITDLSYRYVLESLAGPCPPGQTTATWKRFWNTALANATQAMSTSPLSDVVKKKFSIATVCNNSHALATTTDMKLKNLRDAGLDMYGTLSTDIHNYVIDYPEKYKVDLHRWGTMDGAVLEALAPDPKNIDAKGNVDWVAERARY